MFVPIQNTTHFSLLNSISNPKSLVKKANDLGYTSLGLTDYNSLSGIVEFSTECKKKNIKPIIGTKLRIHENEYLTLISKNLTGWKTLIKLISDSNSPENFINKKSTLTKDKLSNYELNNLIVILGDLESELFQQCFSYHGFLAKSEAEATIGIASDIEDKIKNYLKYYLKNFSSENIFIQLNLLNNQEIPYQKLIVEILRKVAKDNGIKCIAGVNSHYLDRKDCLDHRLLSCSDQKTTFNQIDLSNWKNYLFFKSDGYHLPSQEEIKELYSEEEIKNSYIVAEMCEKYDITNKPLLPKFDCPENQNEIEYLRNLARNGYQNKKQQEWDSQFYGDRAKTELSVIEKSGLAGYFLIVQDYVNWAKNQGYLIGPSRGSSAGSLICYLTGITEIDPIPYKLIFERFYNEGRNTQDNIAYPDIDIDFPKFSREKVIEYITKKYGEKRVAGMVTFGSLQGRSAIREVLRIQNGANVNTINEISKLLPHKHKIADKLEEDQEQSIIQWTLKNEPKLLEEYVNLDENGISGELAQYFEQAIRIEGIYKNQGKHASGVVVCGEDINTVCPTVYHEDTKEQIIGVEMKSAEKLGLIKMDFLGLSLLNKCMGVSRILQGLTFP